MLRKFLLPLIALSLVFGTMGCSSNSTEADISDDVNLSEDFGGYTTETEAPAFNDPDLIEQSLTDAAYDDPMLSSDDVDWMYTDPEAGRYHIRMVWGSLRYDPTITTVTDWTGSLTISRGAEVIRRLINWELNQDFIIPRTDRRLIEWISFTTIHNDGLSIDLLVPPIVAEFDTTFVTDPNTNDTIEIIVDTIIPDVAPVEVVFETGPYSRTFTLPEIAALDTVITLDDGNAIAFHGLKVDRNSCPKGFLTGIWGFNDEGEGVFRGAWRGKRGEIAGWYKGNFGIDENGKNVFVGKWINLSGEFEGFIDGIYLPLPNENATDIAYERAGGWFKGNIYDSEKKLMGVLKGRYKPAYEREGGFMQGRWKVNCPEDNMNNGIFEPDNYEDGF